MDHLSLSPYNSFDNNPVFWADPSGGDSESFFLDLFSRSSHGEIWQNNDDGTFSSNYNQTAQCEQCILKGGEYNGKKFDDIQNKESPWYVRIFGTNKITSKSKKSWDDFDSYIENEISNLDELEDLLDMAAGLSGFAPLDLSLNSLKDIFKSENKIKSIRNILSKVKNITPKQLNMFMFGVVLYLESLKLGITKNSLIELNNNNVFEKKSNNGVLIITNTYITQGTISSTFTVFQKFTALIMAKI